MSEIFEDKGICSAIYHHNIRSHPVIAQTKIGLLIFVNDIIPVVLSFEIKDTLDSLIIDDLMIIEPTIGYLGFFAGGLCYRTTNWAQ